MFPTLPGLPPNQAPSIELNFSPLPVKLEVDGITLPNGERAVVLTFSTPQGVNAFFVNAGAVDAIVAQMKAQAAGIQVVGG